MTLKHLIGGSLRETIDDARTSLKELELLLEKGPAGYVSNLPNCLAVINNSARSSLSAINGLVTFHNNGGSARYYSKNI